jgi:DNA-binding XRE family transcriptional regulator
MPVQFMYSFRDKNPWVGIGRALDFFKNEYIVVIAIVILVSKKYGKGGNSLTRLKQLRQAKGLSIAGVGYETRIHPTTLSLTERRKLAPSPRVRQAVSSFLGVTEDEVFDVEGLAV